jgi:hypothetical protein
MKTLIASIIMFFSTSSFAQEDHTLEIIKKTEAALSVAGWPCQWDQHLADRNTDFESSYGEGSFEFKVSCPDQQKYNVGFFAARASVIMEPYLRNKDGRYFDCEMTGRFDSNANLVLHESCEAAAY